MPADHAASWTRSLVAPRDGRGRVCVHLRLCVPEQGQHASELRVALPVDASSHAHSPSVSSELKVRASSLFDSGSQNVLVSSLVQSGQVSRQSTLRRQSISCRGTAQGFVLPPNMMLDQREKPCPAGLLRHDGVMHGDLPRALVPPSRGDGALFSMRQGGRDTMTR